MRSPGPRSPSPPPATPPGLSQEALLHGQFTGWSAGGGGTGGSSGSSSSSCPSTPTGASLSPSPASSSYALTLTPTHIHVQRLSPGKHSRLLMPLAELTGCGCPREPAPPLLVLYWYPARRRRRGVSKRRHVHAYQAESRAEAEKWNAAVHCLLRGLDVSSTTEFSKSMLPRPRRLLLLVNPFSGRGQAMDWCQTHILPMIREANISYNLIPTKCPGHARELVRDIALREWDGVIIVSGDGLLHEVINGLMDRPDWDQAIKTPVGVLPCGSGNALAGSVNHYAGYDMCLREPLLLNCCFLLCRGGVRPMDLVSVTTSPSSPSSQNGHPSTPTRLFSFLSVAWGFVSDVDIESERYRGLGSARFTLGTLVRLASLRSYQGRLSYLPSAVVDPVPNSTSQPSRRPLSRSITEGLEGFCRTPIHRTCSDMGISEQRSLRKGDGEREREEREQERERRRERARGTGVVRASSLAEDREREMEAEERMEGLSGSSLESSERQECDRNGNREGEEEEEEEEEEGQREREKEMDGALETRDVRDGVDEVKEGCRGSSEDTPLDPRQALCKNSALSTQLGNAFFSQPISVDSEQDLATDVDGPDNGSCFQQEAFLRDPARERALTISSPFRQAPFSYKPKLLDQNQNQSPSRPRPVSLLQHANSNSLPPKFPSLSLSQSATPVSCASPPGSAYLVPQPSTPGSVPPLSFHLPEPTGPGSSPCPPPDDDLLPPLDQPLPTRDWVTVEGEFVLVLAIYQSHLGADLLAAPHARFDDGLIHLTFVRAGISRATLLRLFLAMERGGHLSLSSPYVSHVSARAFRLQPLSPRGTLTVDGELVPYGPLQAQIHPSMARLIVGDSGVKVTRF